MLCMDGGFSGCIKLCKGVGEVWIKMWATVLRVLAGRELSDPNGLSGGEQQRLCIARAVVHQPSLLIADEPSANLDRAYALDIMELFKSFHQVGTTVIVSAHDETLMQDYGHRILRLQGGRFAG